MSGMVRVTEVGPRDGLQNERAQVPVADKVAFVNALIAAGFPEVEVTSFVSPKWVPQLADGAEVMLLRATEAIARFTPARSIAVV